MERGLEAHRLPPPLAHSPTGTNLLPRLRWAKQPEDVSAVGFAESRKTASKEDVVQPRERALQHDKARLWRPHQPGAPPTSRSPDLRQAVLTLPAPARSGPLSFLSLTVHTCAFIPPRLRAECLPRARCSSRCVGHGSQ